MAYDASVLKHLGLAADAKDADVVAAIMAAQPGVTPIVPDVHLTPEQIAANAATEQELARRTAAAGGTPTGTPELAVAASGALETVQLTKSVYEDLLRSAELSKASAGQLAVQRRDQLITTALSESRILEADIPMVVKMFGENEQVATTMLTGLASRLHLAPKGYTADTPGGLPATVAAAFSSAPGELTDDVVASAMEFIGLAPSSKLRKA